MWLKRPPKLKIPLFFLKPSLLVNCNDFRHVDRVRSLAPAPAESALSSLLSAPTCQSPVAPLLLVDQALAPAPRLRILSVREMHRNV